MGTLSTLGNYIVLVIGISLIGLFWALTSESDTKQVVRDVALFGIWAVVCYTIQLVTGVSL